MIKTISLVLITFFCLASATRLYAEYSAIGEEIVKNGKKKEFIVETLDGRKYKGKINQITTEKIVLSENKKAEPIEINIGDIKKIKTAKDKGNMIFNGIAAGGIIFFSLLLIGLSRGY